MDKTIRFYKKNVYGNDLLYPVDQVEAIETLTGKKTITPTIMKGLRMMGFVFVEVMESSVNAFAGVKVGVVGKMPEDDFEQARRQVG